MRRVGCSFGTRLETGDECQDSRCAFRANMPAGRWPRTAWGRSDASSGRRCHRHGRDARRHRHAVAHERDRRSDPREPMSGFGSREHVRRRTACHGATRSVVILRTQVGVSGTCGHRRFCPGHVAMAGPVILEIRMHWLAGVSECDRRIPRVGHGVCSRKVGAGHQQCEHSEECGYSAKSALPAELHLPTSSSGPSSRPVHPPSAVAPRHRCARTHRRHSAPRAGEESPPPPYARPRAPH